VITNLRRKAGAQVLIARERDLSYLVSGVLVWRKGLLVSRLLTASSTELFPQLCGTVGRSLNSDPGGAGDQPYPLSFAAHRTAAMRLPVITPSGSVRVSGRATSVSMSLSGMVAVVCTCAVRCEVCARSGRSGVEHSLEKKEFMCGRGAFIAAVKRRR
jgi:hypothetical protein